MKIISLFCYRRSFTSYCPTKIELNFNNINKISYNQLPTTTINIILSNLFVERLRSPLLVQTPILHTDFFSQNIAALNRIFVWTIQLKKIYVREFYFAIQVLVKQSKFSFTVNTFVFHNVVLASERFVSLDCVNVCRHKVSDS